MRQIVWYFALLVIAAAKIEQPLHFAPTSKRRELTLASKLAPHLTLPQPVSTPLSLHVPILPLRLELPLLWLVPRSLPDSQSLSSKSALKSVSPLPQPSPILSPPKPSLLPAPPQSPNSPPQPTFPSGTLPPPHPSPDSPPQPTSPPDPLPPPPPSPDSPTQPRSPPGPLPPPPPSPDSPPQPPSPPGPLPPPPPSPDSPPQPPSPPGPLPPPPPSPDSPPQPPSPPDPLPPPPPSPDSPPQPPSPPGPLPPPPSPTLPPSLRSTPKPSPAPSQLPPLVLKSLPLSPSPQSPPPPGSIPPLPSLPLPPPPLQSMPQPPSSAPLPLPPPTVASLPSSSSQSSSLFQLLPMSPTPSMTLGTLHRTLPSPTPTETNAGLNTQYNCSALEVPTTNGSGLGCLWCDNTTACNNSTKCHYFSSCPLSMFSSIFPTSGSLLGGTEITLRNYSQVNQSLIVRQIHIGSVECILAISEKQILCLTGKSAVVGTFYLNILLAMPNGEPILIGFLGCVFTYAQPVVLSVFPTYGPLSGGTMVTIFGQALNIGNVANTVVFLSGAPCIMPNITGGGIQCVSTKAAAIGSGQVDVLIDNSTVTNMNTVNYTYGSDPQFLSVSPNLTIPAGGVTLTITGSNLNIVQNPMLVFYDDQIDKRSACKPLNSNALQCTAPALSPSSLVMGQTVEVNYTLIMDNAAGPNLTGLLKLFIKPNPIFYPFNTSQHYVPNSLLQLLGQNILSVQTSELCITVGTDFCTVVYSTDSVVICQMPAQLSHGNTLDVKVKVANGTLTYALGTLKMETQQPSLNVLIIAGSTALIVGCAVLVIVITLVIIYCTLKITKRNKSTRRQSGSISKSRREEVEEVPLNPITSTCQTPFIESGSHVYEVITDRKGKKDNSRYIEYDTPSTHSQYDVPSPTPKHRASTTINSYDFPVGVTAAQSRTNLELSQTSGEYVDMA